MLKGVWKHVNIIIKVATQLLWSQSSKFKNSSYFVKHISSVVAYVETVFMHLNIINI